MKEFKSYKDLKIIRDMNIEVRESFLELKEQLNRNILKGPSDIGAIDLSSVGKSYSWTMESYLVQLDKIDNQLAAVDEIINGLEKSIGRVDKKLEQLKGLDYKVSYLRDIEGYTLAEIADKLGYSERHIKRISAACK